MIVVEEPLAIGMGKGRSSGSSWRRWEQQQRQRQRPTTLTPTLLEQRVSAASSPLLPELQRQLATRLLRAWALDCERIREGSRKEV